MFGKKVRLLQETLASVSEVAMQKTLETRSLYKELSLALERIKFLHEKAYPNANNVKFITSLPRDYYKVHVRREVEWAEAGGLLEETACVAPGADIEEIKMNYLKVNNHFIRVGYSERQDCWYFNLEER